MAFRDRDCARPEGSWPKLWALGALAFWLALRREPSNAKARVLYKKMVE